ncbi:MAG: hypothetical protein IPL32_19445 [Chloracidobacterium sp.]|nr:hypothetical protein [Chloracidobacterium sp.]
MNVRVPSTTEIVVVEASGKPVGSLVAAISAASWVSMAMISSLGALWWAATA